MVFQDAEGHITAANPAAQRILGLTLGQLQGRKSVDPRWRATREDGRPYPGENHPAMVALRTGRPVHDALMGVYNPVSDEQRWIRVDATPFVPCEADARREVYTTFQDVTELRAAEQALRESEALFRPVFDQVPLGAALTDTRFRFTQVNDALCAMLGYAREELLQLGFPDVTHPDEVDVAVLGGRRLAAGEIDELVREKRYVRKDGGIVWGRVAVRRVVDAAGARVAQLALVHDVTEHRRAAEALRESETRCRIVADSTYDWE